MPGEGGVITNIITYYTCPLNLVFHNPPLNLLLPNLTHLFPLVHDLLKGGGGCGEEGLFFLLVYFQFLRTVVKYGVARIYPVSARPPGYSRKKT